MTTSRSERIEAIFNNFHSIKRAYSDGSRFSHRHFGVTMTQASVLMILMHHGRHTMGQIALALGISKSAASQLLDSLIEQGLVERTIDESDRRVVHVDLSGRGHRHLKRMRLKGLQKIIKVFDQLDDEELAQIEAITTKLVQGAKEVRQ